MPESHNNYAGAVLSRDPSPTQHRPALGSCPAAQSQLEGQNKMRQPDMLAAPALGARPSKSNRFAAGAIARLVSVIEFAAATLIVAEFGLLLLTVFMRYFIQRPLVWADELGVIGLLWLGVLSAAIAVHRGEHMRLTALMVRFPKWNSCFEAVASMTSLLFLVLMLQPAYEHVMDEAIMNTPALEISEAWKAAALVVGLGLMAVLCVGRILARSSARDLAISSVLIASVAGILWLLRVDLLAMGNYNLLVF